jgi:hypothetical protein
LSSAPLVDAFPATYSSIHHFELAPARIVILLASALGKVTRPEGTIGFSIEEALAFALSAVSAAFAGIWVGYYTGGQLAPAYVSDRTAAGATLLGIRLCAG